MKRFVWLGCLLPVPAVALENRACGRLPFADERPSPVVRFVRLQYAGGDWDQDFGIGADQNLLLQYGVRTGRRTADETESCTVAKLAETAAEKTSPLLYVIGQRRIELSDDDAKTLREYLLDKHGLQRRIGQTHQILNNKYKILHTDGGHATKK